MGLTNIELEGDEALSIMKKLQMYESDLSPIGTLIDEARNKASAVSSCNFNNTGT